MARSPTPLGVLDGLRRRYAAEYRTDPELVVITLEQTSGKKIFARIAARGRRRSRQPRPVPASVPMRELSGPAIQAA